MSGEYKGRIRRQRQPNAGYELPVCRVDRTAVFGANTDQEPKIDNKIMPLKLAYAAGVCTTGA